MAADGLSEAFLAALARRRATGERTPRAAAADRAVARLAAWGARRALVAGDPWLDDLGVPEALGTAGVEVVRWPAGRGWRELLGLDGAPPACAVTVPALAVARRGTLVLESAPGHGRSLDAVGWWHLAVLDAGRLVPTLGEALARTYAPGRPPPSGVSLVSGPSRTSDIEKIATYGAHGALAEHVLLVEGAAAA
jgi:L-lactate utilization protein LutC